MAARQADTRPLSSPGAPRSHPFNLLTAPPANTLRQDAPIPLCLNIQHYLQGWKAEEVPQAATPRGNSLHGTPWRSTAREALFYPGQI
ncbi:hypothetical protein E2C01_094003 [Portunus trituberculatus]|uniref:Uncharacterized protein n=1 Tax=Portunus trituberculatus TaxID=210409 RepID=A0A5B7K0B4_PORTR|nr:hypothetical protein [Portunus trituberculatus]